MRVRIELDDHQSEKVKSGEWVPLAVVCLAPNENRMYYLMPENAEGPEIVAVLKKYGAIGKGAIWIAKRRKPAREGT